MEKSAELLSAAVKAGDNDARFALGLLYLLGRGVKKDVSKAMHLFSLAEEAGDRQAAHFRNMAAENLARGEDKKPGNGASARAAIKEAQRRRRFPKPKLVEKDEE